MLYSVCKEDIGKRLDTVVSAYAGISRAMAQKLIESGCVTVCGKIKDKKYQVSEFDTIDVQIPESKPSDVSAQDIPLDIVYEDDDLIVINKPKGMVVHPAPGNPDNTLVNALLYHSGSTLSGIGGVIRPGIVHRIDKETSGMIVVAKNDEAHIDLSSQLKDHTLGRIYHAVVLGNIKDDEGTICAPIGRSVRDRKKMAVTAGGRDAVTHYRVIARYNGYTYVECRLETGRTHQIRVHFASTGHPLLGDTVYGNGKNKWESLQKDILMGQCLHAKEIEFIHPKSKERMHFTSDLPEYFKIILQKLENMSK